MKHIKVLGQFINWLVVFLVYFLWFSGVDYSSRRIFLEFGVYKSVEYTDMIFFAWEIFQELWLDRVTGRVCMSISAKGMAITGIEDRRYWNWLPTEESR